LPSNQNLSTPTWWETNLDGLLVSVLVLLEIAQLEAFCPTALVEVEKHRLLELCLPETDGNAVIVPVQAVDKGLR
jgi:hypothetical protein